MLGRSRAPALCPLHPIPRLGVPPPSRVILLGLLRLGR